MGHAGLKAQVKHDMDIIAPQVGYHVKPQYSSGSMPCGARWIYIVTWATLSSCSRSEWHAMQVLLMRVISTQEQFVQLVHVRQEWI